MATTSYVHHQPFEVSETYVQFLEAAVTYSDAQLDRARRRIAELEAALQSRTTLRTVSR